MKHAYLLLAALLFISVASETAADGVTRATFDDAYAIVSQDLLNNMGELATITDFVYQKDIATFTFKKGSIHLLRYVNGRPTTAIFVGEGSVSIAVPSRVERQGLQCVSGDSAVNQTFETCFIRFADDLDIRLKEKFTFSQQALDWKLFNTSKQAQGELFFRPVVSHGYDLHFQLARSALERSTDGFFWVDFNRYVFMYDPSRPEEVQISYQTEGTDIRASTGVSLSRMSANRYSHDQLSQVEYPTTPLGIAGKITTGGQDGRELKQGIVTLTFINNRPASQFLTLFLDHRLKLDSVLMNAAPLHIVRRSDFDVLGLLLPKPTSVGDTVSLTLWYRGTGYRRAFPYVENPAVVPHTLTFVVPKGFNYLATGEGERTAEGRTESFQVAVQGFGRYDFLGYATGYDTVTVSSEIGIPMQLLKSNMINKRNFNCFVPDDDFQVSVVGTFDALASLMGAPVGVQSVSVFPERPFAMPGFAGVPQVTCLTEGVYATTGGLGTVAGRSLARQWLGNQMKPRSDRESWLAVGLTEYLGLMAIQRTSGSGAFYNNLVNRRDSIYRVNSYGRDMPLATGSRCDDTTMANKGVWLFHMLRMLMYDLESGSEDRFLTFLRSVYRQVHTGQFTNADIIAAAEKAHGSSLESFFDAWLYSRNIPTLAVTYGMSQSGDGWFIDGKILQSGMGAGFEHPVICRITAGDGNDRYERLSVKGEETVFRFGPFTARPGEFVFNEFVSTLSRDRVKQN